MQLFLYMKLKLWLYLLVFVCFPVSGDARTDLHQTWHACSFRPGQDHRRVKNLKTVLGLSLIEDVGYTDNHVISVIQ